MLDFPATFDGTNIGKFSTFLRNNNHGFRHRFSKNSFISSKKNHQEARKKKHGLVLRKLDVSNSVIIFFRVVGEFCYPLIAGLIAAIEWLYDGDKSLDESPGSTATL